MFSYISNDQEKVFGIGLSRTGTTSLNRALQMLGLKAFHWNFRPQNRLLTLEDAYFCDAITDINAAWSFETLARMFPPARFVYTVRTPEIWEKSVAKLQRSVAGCPEAAPAQNTGGQRGDGPGRADL